MPIIQDQVGVINAKLLSVPILDQSIEHIKVVREINDTCWIAVRKPNWHGACKCTLRRNKPILSHCDVPQWLVTQNSNSDFALRCAALILVNVRRNGGTNE